MGSPPRSMRLVLIAASGLAPLVLGACALLDRPSPQAQRLLDQIAMGRGIAAARCRTCHQLDGPVASVSAPPLAVIAETYRSARLDWELQAISEVGHYRMPPTPMSAEEISSLAVYIQSLDHESRRSEPGTRRRG